MLKQDNERGFALISVVVIGLLIATLAIGLMGLIRGVAEKGAGVASDVELRAITEAGINRIILAYTRPGDPLRPQLVGDGRQVKWQFDRWELSLSVQAESGKIDLNAGNKEQIEAVATHAISNEDIRREFLRRVEALRDSGTHIGSLLEALPAIGRMSSSAEEVAGQFTLLTRQMGFDPRTASGIILGSSGNFSAAEKDRILQQRAAGQPLALARSTSSSGAFVSERPVYTFYAKAVTDAGRAGIMSAIVEFSNQGRMTIHHWAPAVILQ